ncbi:activated RNA polymerase II transcriptional coactivator p15 [Tribolium castaneum]|uniref:RNA polymerase II transcriptional coactivator-like Protein n=1 Tax=Tribolium castaneum TaxID=7070 RepID=D6WW15_TRICA|nr:PREDICTED: activated RNA polymerase II transcriptional coactivator p15 [Tribolium castaneum]EFA08648.1 RNA polymerase II transcriptional coactivator-like Protein [Tribolium castaneum]|eukprot:XP_967011.1 PREDICTED: activated RNA polymerase II transcriptional coactivator p15 [Tribolium castaneum]
MPKNKKSKKSDTSDSDSGPEDRGPVKKQKTQNKSSGDSDENSWDLGKNRFVKLTEFKGKWYVNIREFYNADGELRPGKKGIMLTMEQWHKFKEVMPELEDAIKRNV